MSDTWYAPFSPLILKSAVPEPLLSSMIEATSLLLADDARCVAHAEQSPVLYDVHRRVELPADLIEAQVPFMDHVHEVTTRYIRGVFQSLGDDRFAGGLDTAQARGFLTSAWINSAYAGDFVPAHKHSCDVSGAVYLKIPEGMAGASGMGGQITFFDGRPHQLVLEKLSFSPQVGELLLFPGWLSHAVHPFRGPGERRMLSFNAVIGFPPPEGAPG